MNESQPPLLQKLQWRYATKSMDPARKVPQDKLERILEAARLAPTSSGLQPFEIVVVSDPAVREKIRAIAWNQAQITDGSHLLVFAAWDNYTPERINQMFDYTNEVRGFKNEGWENYRQMLLIRRFEEKAGQLYGMGLIGGFCHLYIGQEAVVVGLEAAAKEGDKRVTSYRDHGHMLACGMDPNGVMAELTGREGGYSKGKGGSMHMFSREKHFYGGHGIVGAQVPLGAGLAFALACDRRFA